MNLRWEGASLIIALLFLGSLSAVPLKVHSGYNFLPYKCTHTRLTQTLSGAVCVACECIHIYLDEYPENIRVYK